MLAAMDMGTGKLQPVSEPVLTPRGWTPIGKLVPGDEVIGSDGTAVRVVGVFPQKDRRVLKVTMNDGSWTYAGPEHLWSVQRVSGRQAGKWVVKTTAELEDSLTHAGSGNLRWKIPMAKPVQYSPASALPVDPYVLGVWLGDGTSLSGGFTSADAEIVNQITTAGYDVSYHGTDTRPYAYTIHGLVGQLRSLGVIGNKNIPEQYLRASVENRLALLQGLMDADGTPQHTGGTEFSTTLPTLRDGVVELAQSLGGVARVSGSRRTWYTYKGERKQGRPSWRVNVKLPPELAPFRLSRKVGKYIVPSKYPPARCIKSIEYSHEEDAVCILVDAPDHLYVTRGFIVTHNTPVAIACAEELLGCGDIDLCMVVVPPALKFQWARALVKFTDLPTEMKKRKKVFTELPAAPQCVVIDGTRAKREAQYASITSDTDYVILGYPNVVDDVREVRRIRPGMVVLDEATQIAGAGSGRSVRIKKTLRPEYRLALTGTPMENGRPEELYSIMEWVDKSVLGQPHVFDSAFVDRRDDGQVTKYKNTPVLHDLMAPAWFRAARADPDVKPYLPDFTEDIWHVDMDVLTAGPYFGMASELYEALQRIRGNVSFDLAAHYAGGTAMDTAVGKVMSIHQAMELFLDHPDLPVESGILYQDTLGQAGSRYCYGKWQAGLYDDALESAKLSELTRKVQLILDFDSKSKVLIYTQWRNMLDIIEAELAIPCVQYHGGMSAGAKDQAIARFTDDPELRVFISSHAGAYGCDMYMADHLVKYDLPWSAGRNSQVDHRHDRASSEFSKIYVHNMITRGTIEERKLSMVKWKGKVWKAVRDRHGADKRGHVKNDVQSLTAFLEDTVPGL